MILALIGNQNCGKTTLFNQLTGSNQHVGNFPGVTVDQKTGSVRSVKNCSVVDLPGIYSLRPYSTEEIVTRDFIINNHPDGIINIVDATNIERNLYLTLQLLEMRIPTVIALNMMDEVTGNGGSIDVSKLSESLGVPIIPISAIKNEGVDELIGAAVKTAKGKIYPKVYDFCESGAIHRCIHAVTHIVEDHAQNASLNPRFAATKLIENDKIITEMLELDENELELVEHSIIEMETEHGMDRHAALADMRYSFIEKICKDTVVKCQESKERRRTIKIDKILTNKYAAIPIFLLIMLTIFALTFEVIGYYIGLGIELGVDKLSELTENGLRSFGTNEVVISLVVDGVFAGVGSVLSFLPYIVVLFFFLSVLEDTGYMARVAFVMDKLLRKIGLSGKSIVPMLLGFGCSVPAVMSARTLSSERDRKMTILLVPFMSCSAKIPIYALFTAAFFTKYRALIMFSLYVIGILLGIIVALILNKTAFKGKPVPFVMELPNYRFPSPKSVILLMWEKAKDFVVKAFTVIFIATVVIWFLQSFDIRFNFVTDSADSMLAAIASFIAPVFKPLGFADWRVCASLVAGFSAKEAVVSTIGILIPGGISTAFTAASAYSFLIFTLLYTPCVAAVTAIRKELKSVPLAALVVVFQCLIAWVMACIVYQFIVLCGG